MSSHVVTLIVNSQPVQVTLEARQTLGEVLREHCGLTGTHLACEHGVCGACTVLVDGQPMRSCTVLAVQADKSSVDTVEGLAEPDGSQSALQTAFRTHHGLQCGFCTPGMLMATTALLACHSDPTTDEVEDYLHGNLCRCTGYRQIVESVLAAAQGSRT